MKKIYLLLTLCAIILCFASCTGNDTIDTPYGRESIYGQDDTSKEDTQYDSAYGQDNSSEEDTSYDSGNTSEKDESSEKDSTSNTESGEIPDPVYDYEIIYDLNGGKFTEDMPSGYFSGKGFSSDKKPVRNGYDFYGWINKKTGELSKKIEIPAGKGENCEFYAVWYTDIDSNGYVLSKNGDTYSVVWYEGKQEKYLEMTREYNGINITRIDQYAFYYRSDLDESVIFLPMCVNEIGKYAFEKATGLCIQISNDKELDSWLSELKTDDTNKQTIEVIKGERPAIGWSKWVL